MFTAQRLVLARMRRGLTQIRLAELTACSKSHIEKLERGLTTPSQELLENLAKAVNFPVAFLCAGPPPQIGVEDVSFRALSKMSARDRDGAISAGTIATAFSAWLDANFVLPQVSVPKLAHLAPEAAADHLRTEWELGDAPINNILHLIESHGIRVFSLANETRDVDAFSFLHTERPFVFLNTMKSGERSRFDAAHELGHLVLHRGRVPDGREFEEEANAFAAAFLMPRRALTARRFPSLATAELIREKRHWGVSLVALNFRLHALNLMSDYHYKNLCISFSRAGYRSNEPNPMPRETSQILRKVFQHLRAKGIGKSDIARDLAVNARDLDEMVFGLVMTSVS